MTKKVKVKGEEIEVSEDTYVLINVILDLTHVINKLRMKTNG